MMVIFEVIVAPGADPEQILSDEVKRSTMAQVMTRDEAAKVGFGGLPDVGEQVVRYIAVARRDMPWVHRALETSDVVGTFRVFDVD